MSPVCRLIHDDCTQLEAHMALRERIVKEKLTELDSKFYVS